MGATHGSISRLHQLKLYLFPSALAVNFFLAVVIIANSLSIGYFLYTTPMVIQINLLSPVWATLLWTGSLYILYVTKDVLEENPSFRYINYALDAAMIGSFFLIVSVILSSTRFSIQPSTRLLFDQVSSWASSFGLILSFAGVFPTLFMTLSQARRLAKLFLAYLFSLLIPIEILALMHWVVYPFDVIGNFGFAWQGAFIELQLFYLVYPLIFWLFIAFLFSWIWVPLLRSAKERLRRRWSVHPNTFLSGALSLKTIPNEPSVWQPSDSKDQAGLKSSLNRFLPVGVLLVSLVLGVFVAWYPYLNPQPGFVGADSLGYYYTITALDGRNLFEAAQLANQINSARVLYHLMLYVFRNLSQLPTSTIIQLLPVLTITANTLAVFWFVKVAEKKALLASLAAVFSVFSFTTVISMYAGTLANWLAVALGFIVFALVLKMHEEKNLKMLFAIIPTLVVAFLIHYWSGLFFMAVLICYLFLAAWGRMKFRFRLLSVLILFGLAVVAISLANIAASRFLAPYDISGSFVEGLFLPEALVAFWTRLPLLIDVWFLGALANPVMLVLALVGAIVYLHQKSNLSRLLTSWVIVGSLLSVSVSPVGENMSQWLLWRTIYLIPFYILATFGLFYIMKLGILTHNGSTALQTTKDRQSASSAPRFQPNRGFSVAIYLVLDFVASALLALRFPLFFSLILPNYLILTAVVHFRIRKTTDNSVVVFMFVLLVVLLLSNYALRSLAPLAVQRFQP